MRKTKRILAAAALAGLAFVGVSAFTASNTQPSTNILGYGSTTVSGATVNSISYNLNAAGDTINSTTLVLAGDTTESEVSIAYNNAASNSCGTGTVTGTNPNEITTYTCDAVTQSTSGLTATHVIVN